jgi:S1-C subfamily serine protease
MKQALVFLAALCLASACLAGEAGAPNVVGAAGDTFKIITDAKAKVFPAVVFVKPIVETYTMGEKQSREVTGSGVIISADGEMVTNNHVVEKAVSIRCLLFDGRHRDAEIVGTDKESDLALLRLKRADDAETFPFAALGDSAKLTEGDFVMAMGAPWGLNRSVSLGIVSCAERYIQGPSEYSLYIQTDASLNPGNSGGPLVNVAGEVVGINSMASSAGGGDLGFAIPSETVKDIIGRLRASKKVPRSWSGITLQPLKDFNQNMYFNAASGVIVSGTDPDSPAAKAGLKNGDRITSIGGQAVTAETDVDLPAVRRLLSYLEPDKPVAVALDRSGQSLEFQLVPRIKGAVEGEELDCPRWNMTVKAVNQFDNPDLYFVRQQGVFIFGTKYPGNAEDAGLRRNDIITSIDGKEIATLDDVRAAYDAALNATPKKTRVVVDVLRGGMARELVLDFAREYKSD